MKGLCFGNLNTNAEGEGTPCLLPPSSASAPRAVCALPGRADVGHPPPRAPSSPPLTAASGAKSNLPGAGLWKTNELIKKAERAGEVM